RSFLATASLRTGAGPYSLETRSTVFEWRAGRFEPFQAIPTIAAKQWKHFRIGTRDFLALAQGAESSDSGRDEARSRIFEWDGARFVPFQSIASAWGYNWCFFGVDGQHFLAYADHALPSVLLRWDGERFAPFQSFEGRSGRAFCHLRAAGQDWLAFANLFQDTVMHRWDGQRFVQAQVLGGPGGREFRWLPRWRGGRLVQVNFLHGTREAPITGLQSLVHRLDGERWVVDFDFPTLGGTDAVGFVEEGQQYLVVSESLGRDIRFATPSRVYRLQGEVSA
ncbi:MAG: hypothetical protein JWQ76_478, partial [Ramlibacter sp.]|nr:hypothetical protein [Ramlibacter sp.]